MPSTSAWLASASGKYGPAITVRLGDHLRAAAHVVPVSSSWSSGSASVPYSASYNEPHRAFAAFSAYRGTVAGTTSCGTGHA